MSGATIGPAGGTFASEGVTIIVPPGAVTQPTTFTVQSAARVAAGAFAAAGPALQLGPTGATFGATVTVTLPYDAVQLVAAGKTPAELVVRQIDASGAGTTLTPVSVDAKNHTLTVSIRSLGAFQAAVAATVDLAKSIVIVNPSSVVADGSSTATVTVTVKNTSDEPYPGVTVVLSASGQANVIVPATGSTDSQGVTTKTIASTAVEGKTITATITATGHGTLSPALVLAAKPTVQFTTSPAAITTLVVAAAPIVAGCVRIDYALQHPASARADLIVEYDDGSGFRKATSAKVAGNEGTSGLATTPAGQPHAFLWASSSDIRGVDSSGVSVRLTPVVNGVVGAPGNATGLVVANGVRFSAATHVAVGTNPIGFATGDLNGDGRLDFITSSTSSPRTVSVRLGDGAGGFTSAPDVTLGTAAQALAIGDLDGDGNLDFLAAMNTDKVAVRLGDGTGGFSAAADVTVGSFPRWIGIADLNRDGKLDFVTLNPPTGTQIEGTASVRLGDGAGGFSGSTDLSGRGFFGSLSAAFADMDGDGKLDLTVAFPLINLVDCYRGDGAGDLLDTLAGGGGYYSWPIAVAVSDVNGDGRLDVLVASRDSNEVWVHTLSPGSLLFTNSLVVRVNDAPTSVVVGDVNGDGSSDLLTSDSSSSTVSVRLGDGAGVFSGTTSVAVHTNPQVVSLGDLNGDGKLDVLALNRGTSDVSIVLNVMADRCDVGFVTTTSLATGTQPRAASVADVTSDGKLDLVTVDQGANSVSVFPGLGNGAFGARLDFATGAGPRGLAIADVNSDGRVDVVTADASGNGISVFLGNGGGLGARQSFAVGTSPGAVVLVDVDGDGHLDAITANRGSDDVSVLAGVGNGTFQAAQNFGVGVAPSGVVVIDANGDGRPDAITANRGSNDVSILLGSAVGTFGAATRACVGTRPAAIASADVNSDGKPDLVTAGEGSNDVSVLLGRGDGTFHAARSFMTGSAPSAVRIADVNSDGKLDLIVTNRTGNSVSVLLGVGDGTFLSPVNVPVGAGPSSVAVADLDRNGTIDLAVANGTANTVSILLGR